MILFVVHWWFYIHSCTYDFLMAPNFVLHVHSFQTFRDTFMIVCLRVRALLMFRSESDSAFLHMCIYIDA
jgi:hypothetical protein